ncbi:MAG: hypothetical protein GY768_14875, partial [Planctomycetaceae bacterium]|nr:hypothetical protein [Planctomycetaceae bacterium]
LGQLMQYFRAPIFVCSAPAERWALGRYFDDYAKTAREVMKTFPNIIVHTGASFWASITRFANPEYPMHHYDAGLSYRLGYLWDRELLRAVACSQLIAQFTEKEVAGMNEKARIFMAQVNVVRSSTVPIVTKEIKDVDEAEPVIIPAEENEGVPFCTFDDTKIGQERQDEIENFVKGTRRTFIGGSQPAAVWLRAGAAEKAKQEDEKEPLIQEVELPKIARERGAKREQEAEPREVPPVKPRPSPQEPVSFGPESPFKGMDVQEEERPSGRMATGPGMPGAGSAEPEYTYKRPEPSQDEAFHAAASLLVTAPTGDRRYPLHPKVEAFREWQRWNPQGTRKQYEKETATEDEITVRRVMQRRAGARGGKAKDGGEPCAQVSWDFTFWTSDNLWGTADE